MERDEEEIKCPLKAQGQGSHGTKFNRYSETCRNCLFAMGRSSCPLLGPEEKRKEWRGDNGRETASQMLDKWFRKD
jgi:hypothetical protein